VLHSQPKSRKEYDEKVPTKKEYDEKVESYSSSLLILSLHFNLFLLFDEDGSFVYRFLFYLLTIFSGIINAYSSIKVFSIHRIMDKPVQSYRAYIGHIVSIFKEALKRKLLCGKL
jgi:hypothetical protein